jgi:hypothetical protein
MHENYLIEKFNVSEFDKLIPLMQDCFGMSVDIEYFKWKFIENPAGEIISFVAKDDQNNIVAFEGLIPEIYFINGKPSRIYQSVDSMTHSGHRRKGLFKKLSFSCYNYITNELKEEILVTGFGGEESTPVLHKLGWTYVFTVYFHFRFRQLMFLRNFFSFFRKPHAAYQVKDISNVDEIIPLINCSSVKKSIQIEKSKDFIRWRISNPRFNYIIKGVFSNNELNAYAIYYLEENKIMLFDICGKESADDAVKFIFTWLDEQVLEKKLKGIITFAQEKTQYSNLLKKNGYIVNKFGFGPMKFKLPFMYYAQKDNIDKYKNKDLWSITPFDHDAF